MKRPFSRGFTIIEVLIVLAVGALILLIVFLAVPALNRNQRNTERKEFVRYIAGALEEYKGQGGTPTPYPDTPSEMCNFMSTYLAERAGSNATCSPVMGAGDCVRLMTNKYTVCYHDRDGSHHGYRGPEDEFSVQLSHWCTPSPNPYPADNGNPITSGNSTSDTATYYYVIWTELEPSGTLCRDNHGSI